MLGPSGTTFPVHYIASKSVKQSRTRRKLYKKMRLLTLITLTVSHKT